MKKSYQVVNKTMAERPVGKLWLNEILGIPKPETSFYTKRHIIHEITQPADIEKLVPEIESHIRFTFKDKKLLVLALTHSSFSRENNERLEFLGDSMLNAMASRIVYTLPHKLSEGDMSVLRADIVNNMSCCEYTDYMNIGKYLLVGRTVERTSDKVRANIFEAVLGAICEDLDYQMDIAMEWFLKTLKEPLYNKIQIRLDSSVGLREVTTPSIKYNYDVPSMNTKKSSNEPISTLCELATKQYRISPIYSNFENRGSENLPKWSVIVTIGNRQWSNLHFPAPTKKEAKARVAESALADLQQDEESSRKRRISDYEEEESGPVLKRMYDIETEGRPGYQITPQYSNIFQY